MSTFQIVITIVIFIALGALFLYIFWNFKKYQPNKSDDLKNDAITTRETINNVQNKIDKLQEHLLELKTKSSSADNQFSGSLDKLKENVLKINNLQDVSDKRIDELLKGVSSLNQQTQQQTNTSQDLGQRIETLNNIFISNYQRGKLGETSLNFILESMLGNNSDVVKKQYTMKNGKRPDVFLSGGKTNIPIDSKFPFANFTELLKLQPKTFEYTKTLSDLGKRIREHVNDVVKYISLADRTEQVVLYIPSQALFELIYSDSSFRDLVQLANKKKVWISGPNTLPILLRAIDAFVVDAQRRANIVTIINHLQQMSAEFKRFKERWDAFDKGVESFADKARNISITARKINTKFEDIDNCKLSSSEKAEETPKQRLDESESTINQ